MSTSPFPALAEDEVHVWLAPLDADERTFAAKSACLSPDERSRADKFRFPRDRDRFVIARTLLRVLLSRYGGVDAGALGFRYGPFGKPGLDTPVAAGDLSFNLSHSGPWALMAIGKARAIGIDIEAVRAIDDLEGLAASTFAAREAAALRALPPEVRLEGFFACWTRKEAYVKATGLGLSAPMSSFTVCTDPRPATVLRPVDPEGAPGYRTLDCATPPGYCGALAIHDPQETATVIQRVIDRVEDIR